MGGVHRLPRISRRSKYVSWQRLQRCSSAVPSSRPACTPLRLFRIYRLRHSMRLACPPWILAAEPRSAPSSPWDSTSFDHIFFTIGIEAIGNRSLGPNDVTVWLYGGDTSSPSGSALLTIAPSGPFNGALNDYVYTAPTDFTLAANTNYWLRPAPCKIKKPGWSSPAPSREHNQPDRSPPRLWDTTDPLQGFRQPCSTILHRLPMPSTERL